MKFTRKKFPATLVSDWSPRLANTRLPAIPDPYYFSLLIDTGAPGATTTVTLPLRGTVNCVVEWGDGLSDTYAVAGNASHIYSVGGQYQIRLFGTLTFFGQEGLVRPNYVRLLSFGKTGLATFQFGLRQCANIVQAPKYLPSTVTNLNQAFLITSSFNGDLSNWDTSNVTDLSQMFQSASAFNNSSITGWNTSKNTSMSRMFDTCPFNQNIGGWDTSSVTDMSQTFLVSSFNQPIGSWNVSNVTNMSSMFQQNSAFNQNIGSWDVGKVTTFTQMFLLASAFNQDLGSWNVGSATTMNRMFESSSFQQDIGAWRPSKCTNFTGFLASRTLTTANYDALLTGWTDFTGAGWNNGSIASFADAGGGQVTVNTSAAHGYANNHVMRITGTTNYDGSYVISNVTLTSFRITATWVTTETGTWNATLQSGVTFGGGGSKYSVGAATTARGVLTGAPYNWTITDGGQA